MLREPSMYLGAPHDAAGLDPAHRPLVERLVEVLSSNVARNASLTDYYAGDVLLRNIGIAVPDESPFLSAKRVRVDCDWPAIAVDRLADRSMFDGFVCPNGSEVADALDAACPSSMVARLYRGTLPSALVHGCAFWTVGRGGPGCPRTVVHAHTARTASALWDETRDRILAGLAIVGTSWDRRWQGEYPDRIDVHLSDCIVELTRPDVELPGWVARYRRNALGRPLMEPLVYRPDSMWRFGHSRISHQVRKICDSMMRENLRFEVTAELNTIPARYATGLTDEQYDALSDARFKNSIGALFMVSKGDDAAVADTARVGQFPQVSLQPHIEVKRDLAADFSGVTGIPMSELGVTHDNPSSAEAISAAEKPLVNICTRMNQDMAASLENVARMVLAVDAGTSLDGLPDDASRIVAHFNDPAMPSLSAATDRAIKIVSAVPEYASTESFWVDVGKDDGERMTIMDGLRRLEGRAALSAIIDRNSKAAVDADNRVGGGEVPPAD